MSHQPAISIIHPERFDSATSQTPGSQRLAAVSCSSLPGSPMWAGLFVVEPEARTGVHHHGEQYTIAYVLDGVAQVRWGRYGESSGKVQAGDFLHVPPFLLHQEINLSSELSFRWVVVRSTPEPIVVNFPDGYWENTPHPLP